MFTDKPKVWIFGPTLTPTYPLKMAETKKSKHFSKEKKYPSSYPNQSKSRPYLLSTFNENYNYFLLYLDFLGGVQMGPRSKIKSSQFGLAPLFRKPIIKS